MEIQAGATISERFRNQSHSFVCDSVSLGDDCFVGHGVMFINDRLWSGDPAHCGKSKWESSQVDSNVGVGSNATILPVINENNVIIGAGPMVTKDIADPGAYPGIPARRVHGV